MLDDLYSRFKYCEKKNTEKMEQLDKYGFDHPTNTIVSGPSGSGKSQILAQILGCADYIFDPSPVKKILFYREDQTIYDQWYESGLITHKQKGMPERDELMSLISETKTEEEVWFSLMIVHHSLRKTRRISTTTLPLPPTITKQVFFLCFTACSVPRSESSR